MKSSVVVSFLGITLVVVTGVYFLVYYAPSIRCKDLRPMQLHIKSSDDIKQLFPQTPQEAEVRARCSIESAQTSINELISLVPEQRTFNNTAQAFDRIAGLSDFAVLMSVFEVIEYVHPQEQMRHAAHAASVKMKEFAVDAILNNRDVYRAFKEYMETNASREVLRPDQQYFLQDAMDSFVRAGLELPDEQLARVKVLNKELAQLGMQFETNIATDNKTITVAQEGLAGLDEDFIRSLKRDEKGDYILGIDYPTLTAVRENCAVADTRKRLSIASQNRGYPANDLVLKEVVAKRDELAKLLGFASYAALNIDSEMAKKPERVREFLAGLFEKSKAKVDQEYALFKQHLPSGVVLTAEGKFNPWDVEFVKNRYKQEHLQLDERAIAEYFPMEQTVKGLLSIYEQFLSLRFEIIPVAGLWHEDVQVIAAYDKHSNTLLGYLLLDLYPRENKYNHACHATIVPSIQFEHEEQWPEVSLVIANFPKSTATKPSLLTRNDVSTFFHEFGHAMHGLLGRTYLATQSGTSVKMDFVEMPSQMLEEWLWDTQILKMLGKHYKTGQALPDELIQKIQGLKHFDSGDWTQRQTYLSSLALALYEPGAVKDPHALQKELSIRMRPHVEFFDDNHMYASFGHLTGYAARYYSYLWSKVFALDMFDHIKRQGLLNPQAGYDYRSKVIGKGGSKDPNQLLIDFLGREPNNAAFIADLGL